MLNDKLRNATQGVPYKDAGRSLNPVGDGALDIPFVGRDVLDTPHRYTNLTSTFPSGEGFLLVTRRAGCRGRHPLQVWVKNKDIAMFLWLHKSLRNLTQASP